MEIKLIDEGWYMIQNCSKVLDYQDAVDLVEEHFDVKIQPGAYLVKLAEVDEDHEECTDVYSYCIIPVEAAETMVANHKRKKNED